MTTELRRCGKEFFFFLSVVSSCFFVRLCGEDLQVSDYESDVCGEVSTFVVMFSFILW